MRKQYPDVFEFSVSYTTRKPRQGEQHGVNYFYVTKEEFMKVHSIHQRVEDNDFIEHVEFAGNNYGTSRSYLEGIRRRNKVKANYKICLLELDIKGAEIFIQKGLAAHVIFLAPPSIEVLKERLLKRGTDSMDVIEKRLLIAETEITAAQNSVMIEKIFVNNDFEVFYKEIMDYMNELYPHHIY